MARPDAPEAAPEQLVFEPVEVGLHALEQVVHANRLSPAGTRRLPDTMPGAVSLRVPSSSQYGGIG